LKDAENTLELTRRKIAAGMVPSSDLTGAEHSVADGKLKLLSAAATIEDAWDALRIVLNLPRDQWDRPILPTDRPHFDPAIVASAESALQTALRRRPELALAALDRQSSDLTLRQAENDRLPQLDLGLNGTISGQGSSYRDALSQIGRHDATGLS